MNKSEFMRSGELCQMLGVSVLTIRAWVREGILPRPMIATKRLHLWHRGEVFEHLRTRRAAANA